MIPPGSRPVVPVAFGKVVDCKDAYLSASPEICAVSGVILCTRPDIDSTASSRGWLPQRPCAGQHARPARRPVSSCRRRAGLLATRNLAFKPLARAAQTHTSRTVGASIRLERHHRDSTSLRLEMAFRSADRSSRETAKTGLRPVGRAAVAAFETGLRPVKRASTGSLAASLHARPARRPVSGCRRRAGLLPTRNVAHGRLSCAAQTHPPHIGDPLPCLRKPRQYLPTLHLEMAFRSTERSSRETAKTGLRPVGRAAVAAFETGLRLVKRASTGRVAIGLHAGPPELFRPCATPPRISRWTTPHLQRDHRSTNTGGATLGAHSGNLETQRDFTGIPASTRTLFLPATLTFSRDGPPNKRLVSDRAGRCAPGTAAQPQVVGWKSVRLSVDLG
jgi:hypothetical protein